MATALGYSPQFAAFHHITHAVGHHVLQHYCVFGGVDKVNYCLMKQLTIPSQHDLMPNSIPFFPKMNS
ncbi:hypothetical protein [Aeromonas allosaccharophila]|uniref:Uncharacterized protein n=1 Tax=Aeromonas allosaccharophila TaxID=656 RepID=A0AAX3NYA4_9GAMM|nr:hypothetical protein [Aeromonas allosaccharophila]WED78045.1 hypothetical protein PYU98_07425 [Aeromonas allosaccharophila]